MMMNCGHLQLGYCQACVSQLVARHQELCAALPKTADGVPIVPGMTLWFENDNMRMGDGTIATVWARKVSCVSAESWSPVYLGGGERDWKSPDESYSTREAALQARRKTLDEAIAHTDTEIAGGNP